MDAPLLHALQAGAIGFLAGGYVLIIFMYRRQAKILHEHTMSLMATQANFKMLVTLFESLAAKGLPEGVTVDFDILNPDMN
jgi:hypothetical protein